MGTDIHTLVQVKKNDKWESVAVDICDNRSYDFFGTLCGIRNSNVPSIVDARGCPEGLETVEGESWDSGDTFVMFNGKKYWMGYGIYSWCLLSEMKEFFEQYKPFQYANLESCIQELEQIQNANGVGESELRFVFGFDS